MINACGQTGPSSGHPSLYTIVALVLNQLNAHWCPIRFAQITECSYSTLQHTAHKHTVALIITGWPQGDVFGQEDLPRWWRRKVPTLAMSSCSVLGVVALCMSSQPKVAHFPRSTYALGLYRFTILM